jgi:predicted nucleic acid-binding Zn ribbon protein
MPRQRYISPEERMRWRLERERNQITDPLPPFPAARVFRPEHVLPKVLKKMGLEKDLQEQRLLGDWATIAGPLIAKHSRPGRLTGRCLYIYVANSAWLTELHALGQADLLKKVQDRLGKNRVTRIRLQLDPDPPDQRA